MRVLSEQRIKENTKTRLKGNTETSFASLFSFIIIILLCSSIFIYSISPVLATEDTEKLHVLLVDGGEIYLRSGYSHTLSQDYQLNIKGTDTEGKRIWIELSRKGVPLQDSVVTEGSQFVYSQNSTEILNLTVDTIYEGADGVLVKFSPVYQYRNPQFPLSQTPIESVANTSNNISPSHFELETQSSGFDMPILFLSLGAIILVISFLAGRKNKK